LQFIEYNEPAPKHKLIYYKSLEQACATFFTGRLKLNFEKLSRAA